jgi:hypothetical protein
MNWIVYNTTDGTILSKSENEPTPGPGEAKVQTNFFFMPGQPLHLLMWDGSEVQANSENNIMKYGGENYRMFNLVDGHVKTKGIHCIDFKAELKTGVNLHKVYEFDFAGKLVKTEYYHNYVDVANKGDLILVVERSHTMYPEDGSRFPSQKRLLSKQRTIKWVDLDGNIDEVNIKTTTIVYDTFEKYNKEGIARRNNIISALTKNVVTGGILSGIFTDADDGEDKLLDLMEFYSGEFASYMRSGKGTIFDKILNDIEPTHGWFANVVPDTAQTQALCPFMIGLTFRNYMIDKLKGIVQ